MSCLKWQKECNLFVSNSSLMLSCILLIHCIPFLCYVNTYLTGQSHNHTNSTPLSSRLRMRMAYRLVYSETAARRIMVDSLKETKNGFLVLRNTPERWEELERLPLLPGDVFIVTYPRSGTTWMQQIVKLLRSDGQPDHVTVDRAIPWLEVGARLGLRIWTGHAHRPGARSLQCASARVICAGVFSLSISCSYLPPRADHAQKCENIIIGSLKLVHAPRLVEQERRWIERYSKILTVTRRRAILPSAGRN